MPVNIKAYKYSHNGYPCYDFSAFKYQLADTFDTTE